MVNSNTCVKTDLIAKSGVYSGCGTDMSPQSAARRASKLFQLTLELLVVWLGGS